ncbi:hypothetical protein E2562_025890 [Oryza meyeriana var. granulata]|uniref:Uncharacterized protein n=1 Tax=Oryza meyeriana var. granulata TaxID=110450 RepID=A0A6G1CJK6_9ORYZ|nr:hypothetical protein E2562_025890 [Oryza meyeriana var. granulata]
MSQCEEWDKFCDLSHMRKNRKAVETTEDFHSETEDTPTNEEEIEFESDQEDVVPIMEYGEEGEKDNDD